jgi:ATP-binding protein involved in chromosome partitioning
VEIDNNKIVKALSGVKDPATGQDIISRRMVSDLRVQDNQVQFHLAVADLPEAQKSSLNFACMEAIMAVYPEANVHIHMQRGDTEPDNKVRCHMSRISSQWHPVKEGW